MSFYADDLAQVHDAGFGAVARAAAGVLLEALADAGTGPDGATVVDLGCGSGILAAELAAHGCTVIGVDVSPAMLDLARRRAPAAQFVESSLYDFKLPPCDAVCLVGECINYLTADAEPGVEDLLRLFTRIRTALPVGGILLLDSAGPGRVPQGRYRNFTQDDNWAVLIEAVEDDGVVERAITTFVRRGALFQRSSELHRLRLWPPEGICELLEETGFRVVTLSPAYGACPLPPGTTTCLAHATR